MSFFLTFFFFVSVRFSSSSSGARESVGGVSAEEVEGGGGGGRKMGSVWRVTVSDGGVTVGRYSADQLRRCLHLFGCKNRHASNAAGRLFHSLRYRRWKECMRVCMVRLWAKAVALLLRGTNHISISMCMRIHWISIGYA